MSFLLRVLDAKGGTNVPMDSLPLPSKDSEDDDLEGIIMTDQSSDGVETDLNKK